MEKLDSLLNRLHPVFPNCPKSYKSYKGIKHNLNALSVGEYLLRYCEITIDINVDGLPISSSKLVGALNESFIIGLYVEHKDPQNFSVCHYVLDAPARTFIKCIIGHNRYGAYEKCTVVDQLIHHQGYSPLLIVKTKMVSQFRLDATHLVYSGVFKRLLMAWLEWKGHFRVNSNIYKYYLLLHVAIYILVSPVLFLTQCIIMLELLRTFITHSVAIYGEKFIVYNVHSIFHLAKECAEHGELDSFSAFLFENRLKSIKESLRSFCKLLEQVAKRDLEKDKIRSIRLPYDGTNIVLSQRHIDPAKTIPGIQYKKMNVSVTFKLGQRDSCLKTLDDIMIITNIIKRNDNSICVVGNKYHHSVDYYDYPLPSSIFGILKVTHLSTTRNVLELSNIQARCWLIHIPNSESCFNIPLLHTMSATH
ncbi:hypothetical protein ACFW04_005422 [Cataglyphis niger]